METAVIKEIPINASLACRAIKLALVTTIIFNSCSALSDESNIESLVSMSLAELLNVKVSIASRREENLNFSPGNTTVYSNQEINAFGARNLGDVLDRMTSMQIITSHIFPHNKLSLRGVNTGLNDTSVLILINGYPFKNANAGGSSPALYRGFPLSVIDRIEVFRGPGSVLYGSNAFAGAINIVTKTSQSSTTSSNIQATVGSFNKKSFEISSQFSGHNYDVLVGANTQTSDGDTFQNITDRFGNTGSYSSGFEQGTVVTSGSIGHFNFTGLYTDYEADNGGGLFKLGDQQYLDKKQYLAVGYSNDLSESWTINLSYVYNDQILEWEVNNSENLHQENDSLEQIAEIISQGLLFENVNVMLGTSRSILKGEVKHGFAPYEIWRQSYFAEASQMVNPTTNIIVGFQWNRPEESEGDLSSRFGVVKQFGENWWLKLSYGEAFRSPFGSELFVDSAGLKGNPALKPEHLKTYETQLNYIDETKQFAVSVYHSDQGDSITRAVLVIGDIPTIVNQGDVEYQGVELEGKVSLTDNLQFTFNANYQTSKTDTGIKDDSFTPNEMIKAGFVYGYSENLSIALFNQYIGESTNLNKTRGVPITNPIPDSYHLLTANLTWDISQYTRQYGEGESSISVYLDNLLDEEIFAPDLMNAGRTNSIPSHDGFSLNIRFQYEF